ncbi:MAG: hypothetical protein R3C14_38150 [Caldilineaceae bacterium]
MTFGHFTDIAQVQTAYQIRFGQLQDQVFAQLDAAVDRADAFPYLNTIFAIADQEAEGRMT